MGAPVTFHLRAVIKDADAIEGPMRRLRDLSEVFGDIVQEWARGEQDKFGLSAAREDAGVDFAGGPRWEPLTRRYQAAKRRAGFPDQLMVRTGNLRDALTDPDRFFHQETERSVFFGTPEDDEAYQAMKGNWDTRQTLFLGADDRRMVENKLFNFINGTGEYDRGFLAASELDGETSADGGLGGWPA